MPEHLVDDAPRRTEPLCEMGWHGDGPDHDTCPCCYSLARLARSVADHFMDQEGRKRKSAIRRAAKLLGLTVAEARRMYCDNRPDNCVVCEARTTRSRLCRFVRDGDGQPGFDAHGQSLGYGLWRPVQPGDRLVGRVLVAFTFCSDECEQASGDACRDHNCAAADVDLGEAN